MLEVATVRSILRGRVGVGVVEAAPEGGSPRDVDFAMGRAAAAGALADHGAPTEEIPTGPDRAPVWPAGVVGSIAHTRGVAVAIVGWTEEFRGLGVDVERADRAVDDGTARRIYLPAEREVFTGPGALLALFCAKEATYKALAPLGATKLGFHDVQYVALGDGRLGGKIVNESVPARVPRMFEARYATSEGFLVAAVQIDAAT